jgi:hypothetical protein
LTYKNLLILIALFTFTSSVQAAPVFINFQDMADNAYGESAWKPLSLKDDFGVDVDIYGRYDGSDVYAYLDANTAGLGVCRDLNDAGDAKLNTKNADSGSNLCKIASDDNVNVYGSIGEELKFVFNEALTITNIWFNNNHDPDYGMDGDTVVIGGSNEVFSGGADDADLGWLFEFTGTDGIFSATDMLSIAYYDGIDTRFRAEEFYISAIEFTVPEPSIIALFAAGLFGLGFARRRRNA